MSLPSPLRLYPYPRQPNIMSDPSQQHQQQQHRGMAPSSRPQSSRPTSAQQRRRQSQQQSSSPNTQAPASGSGGPGQGNELLFLTYSNPAEFSNSRTNRRIVKKWASTTGLKNIRSQETPQDESRSTSRSRSSRDPSSSTSRKRPTKLSTSPAAPSSESSHVDARVLTASPSPADADVLHGDAQRDAQRIAYYRENYQPHQSASLPLRPARPTPAQADEIRRILGYPETGRAWSDPFDDSDLPVEESEYVGDLILHYLRGDLMSKAWLEGEYDDVKGRLLPMRASFWFPLMLQSRAAYCAMRKRLLGPPLAKKHD